MHDQVWDDGKLVLSHAVEALNLKGVIPGGLSNCAVEPMEQVIAEAKNKMPTSPRPGGGGGPPNQDKADSNDDDHNKKERKGS